MNEHDKDVPLYDMVYSFIIYFYVVSYRKKEYKNILLCKK